MLFLDDTRRSGVVIGSVYFCVFLLTSYSSRSSDKVSKRFPGLADPINLTYIIGVCFIFIAGLATNQGLAILSILVFLGFYVLQNLRKPMSVAFLSDQINQNVMASGLSVETQFTTIFAAIIAPILGGLADKFGVGLALAVLGICFTLVFFFIRVEDKAKITEQR